MPDMVHTQGETKIHNQYEPLWKLLTAKAGEKVRKRNYEKFLM